MNSKLNTFQNRFRRGFNLVELLIALGITAALLTSTLVALNASFVAYQATTEVSSTHTVSRLTIHRLMAMIRTGTDFAPYPMSALETIVSDDYIQFRTPEPDGRVMAIEWIGPDDTNVLRPQKNAVYVVLFDSVTLAETEAHVLLEGVLPQYDPPSSTSEADRIKPFTLQYDRGKLYRAMIDLSVTPDDNMSTTMDGQNNEVIRLVASAMPRTAAYKE